MARPRTVKRVHEAVLEIAERGGPGALTMEGIAARAGVGKQTLYRSWPSVHAVLFDALASESAGGDEPTGTATDAETEAATGLVTDVVTDVDVVDLLRAAGEEISTEPRSSLLRALAASIQADEVVASEFRERLLEPQLAQIALILAGAGYPVSRTTIELLIAPVFYRWFLRLPPLNDDELAEHAERTLASCTAAPRTRRIRTSRA